MTLAAWRPGHDGHIFAALCHGQLGQSLGGNILTDAFGVVAMVAMTPLITIQGLGLIYKRRMAAVTAARQFVDTLPDDIIDYQQEAA